MTTVHHQIPSVAIIVAMTEDHLIGAEGSLPWHLPEDLKLFRQITSGKTVIMGRKTFEAIGHPLKERINIVVSRSMKPVPGIEVCTGLVEGLAIAAGYARPVFVIGGSSVYRKALPIANEMHISWVNGPFSGDCYFPRLELSEWAIVAECDFPGFRYSHYRRIRQSAD